MRQSLRAAEQNMHLSDAQHAGGQVVGDPPYKGMQSYDSNDAPLFFGREALTAELVAYLRDRRFLAVVGASGSGKSSVVRAGLVPAVQKTKALPKDIVLPAGSERWPVHIMTPKAHPLKELAATLTRNSGSPLKQARLIDELAEDRRVLDLYVSQVLSGTAADRLLLVVDQFEELFTLCKDQTERKAFIDNL
ncbi:MAG: ATP-binding protein, partial [Caldilineaceae bacterium]|nr:ATP-binding protein [Caldilineaceae bacterium]